MNKLMNKWKEGGTEKRKEERKKEKEGTEDIGKKGRQISSYSAG